MPLAAHHAPTSAAHAHLVAAALHVFGVSQPPPMSHGREIFLLALVVFFAPPYGSRAQR